MATISKNIKFILKFISNLEKNNQEKTTKHIHLLEITWESEDSFNGSFTHSQFVLNSLNEKNSFKSKLSSLVESEYPSLNDVLRADSLVEEYSEDMEEYLQNRQHYPQFAAAKL